MDAHEKLIVTRLSKHAAEAPSDHDLLAAVHHRLRRRRTGRAIGAAVLACAAIATAITATHSISGELRTDPEVSRPAAPDTGWRWESYQTVQVQVPADWTQYISGPAPCTEISGSGSSSGKPAVGRFNGWLGPSSYVCEDAVLPAEQRLPYLWFNDVQNPGIKPYDAGWTEETRLVAGVKISVLTQDDALRRRILDSARPNIGTDYYGCAPTDTAPRGTGLDPDDRITSASICEYWNNTLVAGSTVSGDPAAKLAQQLAASPAGEPAAWGEGCSQPDQRTFVVTLHGRSKSYPVRITVAYCYADRTFPTDDGVTQRRTGYETLDLIRQGVHQAHEPSQLFDPARPLTPSPR
ncbi:hypothetical protein AB0F43_12085 [Kribbella sp. NPDC023972]|uniref:hypothetical protein n=1 Tax=Kribbella sp. NPDC023972 TaxID=3154795 RepID=UPI0033BFF774